MFSSNESIYVVVAVFVVVTVVVAAAGAVDRPTAIMSGTVHIPQAWFMSFPPSEIVRLKRCVLNNETSYGRIKVCRTDFVCTLRNLLR